jgi:hypothetical protein
VQDADVDAALPTTAIDPIEDSQVNLQMISKKELHVLSHHHSMSITTPIRPIHKIPFGTGRIEKMGSPAGQLTAPIHQQRYRKFAVNALADGFEGLDISLCLEMPKKRSAKKVVGVVKVERRTLVGGQLQLASGFLPQLSRPLGTLDIGHSSNASRSGPINGSLETPLVSRNTPLTEALQLFVCPTKPSNVGVDQDQYNNTDQFISHQLSRITAPVREDSDSSSDSDFCSSKSDQDLGEEDGQRIQDDDSQGIATPSAPDKFDTQSFCSCQTRDEPSYFWDDYRHVNGAEDAFWSQ